MSIKVIGVEWAEHGELGRLHASTVSCLSIFAELVGVWLPRPCHRCDSINDLTP
jgi:hypothetical protein